MIQVDVFWAYAFGAMFASAAARQIKNEFENGKAWWESKYFMICVFYLAVFFAPSGAYLLWAFPHWESMQVFRSHSDVAPILAVFFSITNVTQGILGYYICYQFIKKGNFYASYLQVLLGYFCMFFILFHGWDGTGWQRFTYDATMHGGTLWDYGKTDGFRFFISNVAITLYIMGLLILPPLFYWLNKWVKEGAEIDETIPKEKVPDNFIKNSIVFLFIVFGIGLGFAIGAGFVCMFFTWLTGGNQIINGKEWSILGMVIGLPLFIVPIYYFLLRRDKLIYKLIKNCLIIEEPIS
ncbi:MAG: hypothetical protein ACTSQJ_10360 [Promethearchaeota archaeon]